MKRSEEVLCEFKVVRIMEDRHGAPFVDVYIPETGQERRLYADETLSLVVDLTKVVSNQDDAPASRQEDV